MNKITTLFLFVMLTCIGQTLKAQYVNVIVSAINMNSLSESTDSKEIRVRYTYVIINNTSTSITNGTVIGKIPAGTVYMPGTTSINAVTVPDVNDKMPYADPGGGTIGTLAPNAQVAR